MLKHKIWLGTLIAGFDVPMQMIDDINAIYDKHIDELPKHNHKLAGKIVDEHKIDHLIPDHHKYHFQSMFRTYLIEVEKLQYDIKLNSAWVNEMRAGEYNPFHFHLGKTDLGLSSVLPLKIPKTYGKEVSIPEIPSNGNLELIGGSQDLLGRNQLKTSVQVGQFYIFPYSLMHGVYPFYETDEKRRTLSYNCDLITRGRSSVG